ncbi:MAG: DUF3649 domain-containing protein [Cellvibrionaceae bacterium]|nr:DUF3649 domain-containing protein [Cellvibrionaceae bacterium]MCV6628100.1 DUF3649 domain-containing protein [Cellvibrionaceae bacterium]
MIKFKNYFSSYNGQVLQRLLAAIVIGYLLANLVAVTLAELFVVLQASRLNATISASLLSFALYTIIFMWVFSVKTTAAMWRGLLFQFLASSALLALCKGVALL